MESESTEQVDLNSTAESQYIYWENRGGLGSVKAFWKTWIDSNFRPFRFFGGFKPEYEAESSISYFLITIIIAALVYIPLTTINVLIMQLLGLDKSAGVVIMSLVAAINSIMLFVGELAFGSVVLVISVSIIYALLKLIRVPNIDLKQINRVILYSSGPLIIASLFFYAGGFILVCLIAAIWSYILICIGLRKTIGISFRKIIPIVTLAWTLSIIPILKTLSVLAELLND
jgi:hypothetical protein